jgi:hypothetical protein
MIDLGTHAYKSYKRGRTASETAAELRRQANELKSKTPSPTWTASEKGSTLLGNEITPVCSRVAEGGAAADHISCAIQTDPNVPKFATNPKFLEEYKALTGSSLDDAINRSNAENIRDVFPSAFQTIYQDNSAGLSLRGFLDKSSTLFVKILNRLEQPSDRAQLVELVVPEGLRTFLPQFGPLPERNPAITRSDPVPRHESEAASARPSVMSEFPVPTSEPDWSTTVTSKMASLESAFDLRFGVHPESNPAINLFERVSARYGLTATSQDLEPDPIVASY